MSKRPTEKQYQHLRRLADPSLLLISGANRDWRPLMKNGWVEAANPPRSPDNGLRITALGLRALADALEAYGR